MTFILSVAVGLPGIAPVAQVGNDAMDQLQRCSQLSDSERRHCLEELSRKLAPAPTSRATPAPPSAPETWVVSETTSPIDYAPIVTATATNDGNRDAMQIALRCRPGRTDLLLGSPTTASRDDIAAVTYAINDGRPIVIEAVPGPSGVALRGDVVRLLTSLPEQGDIVFRLVPRVGAALQRRLALADLKRVVDRMAATCNWPARATAPRR